MTDQNKTPKAENPDEAVLKLTQFITTKELAKKGLISMFQNKMAEQVEIEIATIKECIALIER